MENTTTDTAVRSDADVKEAVEKLLETYINPALASHGGFVHLVKMEGRNVYLELGGGCKGCAGARATMRYGVEAALREAVPEIGRVIDATDHGAGRNPYM